jgi:hypothetical protein
MASSSFGVFDSWQLHQVDLHGRHAAVFTRDRTTILKTNDRAHVVRLLSDWTDTRLLMLHARHVPIPIESPRSRATRHTCSPTHPLKALPLALCAPHGRYLILGHPRPHPPPFARWAVTGHDIGVFPRRVRQAAPLSPTSHSMRAGRFSPSEVIARRTLRPKCRAREHAAEHVLKPATGIVPAHAIASHPGIFVHGVRELPGNRPQRGSKSFPAFTGQL